MTKPERTPIHPGEFLREDFMEPLGLSINALARALHVTPMRISDIVNERRGITADTALRLSLYFGNSPELWIGLQSDYDLDVAKQNVQKLKSQIQPRVA